MNFFAAGLLVLCVSMVYGDYEDGVHLNYTMTSSGEDIREFIDVNVNESYVLISTPAHRGASDVAMLHDYTMGVNVLKRASGCYILHGYDGVPDDIDAWEKVQTDQVDERVGEVTGYRAYVFRPIPVTLNRTTLPESVGEFCEEDIGLAVVEEVIDGDEALDGPRDQGGDNGETSEIFVPGRVTRVKRWGWARRAWRWVKRIFVPRYPTCFCIRAPCHCRG